MPLTILTSSQTKSLLLSLTRDDIVNLQHNLAEALREYSIGNQEAGCCATFQPQRTKITRKNGLSTVFMPASTGDCVGLKIVSLREETDEAASNKGDEQGENIGGESLRQSKRSSTATTSLESSSKSSTQSTTSALSSLTLSPKIDAACDASTRASLTMLDSTGAPTGLMNAAEVTAFRTALITLLVFNRRSHVETITVFGAGKQAYWHIRLALLLRGSEIKHVNIINRCFERATNILREFYSPEHSSWRSDVKFSALGSDFVDYDLLLKENVRKADVIFCCTTSPEPLFPAKFLTSNGGKKKGRFVTAVGSYNPQMAELHPEILQDAVTKTHHHRPLIHHRPQPRREGVIVVDSVESCLQEAGEVVQAGLTPKQLVEVGELMLVKQASKQQIDQGGEGERGFREWMERGDVVYKSVGMGVMDLVVGRDLIRLAAERNSGTTIEDF